MGGGVSKMAKQELVATIRDRYQQACKKDKGRILDEFTAITGHHRKHGIRLLSGTADNQGQQVVGRRIYDEAVREAVIVVWEAWWIHISSATVGMNRFPLGSDSPGTCGGYCCRLG